MEQVVAMPAPYKHQNTDNFRTSVQMAEADQYHLSLNLELLRGCQFSCKGCHVDVYGAKPMTDEWAGNITKWLDAMTEHGDYLPTVVFIAPTDILSADNTFEVLADERVISVIRRFKRLSIQSTCLDVSKGAQLGEALRKHFSHMELEVNILMEPEHVETEKYLQTIRKNRDELYAAIDWPTPIRSFCIMNVYEYERVKKQNIAKLLADYKYMHKRIEELFDTTIDFNFSMSRKKQTAPGEVEIAIHRITKMFDAHVNDKTNQFIRFSFGKLTDCLIERHYNWLNGKFFVSPLLYDRYAAFVPSLEVPFVDFTMEELEAFEEKLEFDQLSRSYEKTSCSSCRYLGSCVQRNVLAVMDIYGIKDCVVATDALDSINNIAG